MAVDFRPLADYASDTTNKEDRLDFMTGLERRTIKANGIRINLWIGDIRRIRVEPQVIA